MEGEKRVLYYHIGLTRHTPFKGLPNLDALKDINGLKVLYKRAQMDGIFEYTCGSADPTKLGAYLCSR